jgi:HJR/Mrr/RecB family endonuclease
MAVKIPTGVSSFTGLKGIGESFTVNVCKQCGKASLNLGQIPDELISVFVGRVTRIDRESHNKRIVQVQASYPELVSGKVLRFPFYHSIKRGDRVVIGGQLSLDWIEPILVRNLSAMSEQVGGSLVAAVLLPFKSPTGQKLEIDNPLAVKARRQIDATLVIYEEAMKSIASTPLESQFNPYDFERLVADLFERLTYQNVIISGGAGDKGVDIRASKRESDGNVVKVVVQCKHQSVLHRVLPTQVRDFAHSIERDKKDNVCRGYFVTSSYFSPECFDKENCGEDMELIDRDQLETLLKKVGLPVPQVR